MLGSLPSGWQTSLWQGLLVQKTRVQEARGPGSLRGCCFTGHSLPAPLLTHRQLESAGVQTEGDWSRTQAPPPHRAACSSRQSSDDVAVTVSKQQL